MHAYLLLTYFHLIVVSSFIEKMDSPISDIEKLYLPSQWAKRIAPDKILNVHIELTKKISEQVKKEIPPELVTYGPLPREKYDLFGADLPNDAPIFIYVHGGYWQEMCREMSYYVVKPLIKNNIKVVVVGYELCPDVTLFKIVDEIKTAITDCLNYAKKVGSRSIYLAGHSAGGHLVASLFEDFFAKLPDNDRKLFKGIFLIAGIYDITPLLQTTVNIPMKLDDNSAKTLSPYLRDVNVSNMKIFLIVGEHDSPAFVKQSEMMSEKLKKNTNNEVILDIKKNLDHFDMVENMNSEEHSLTKIIIETIKNN